MTKLLGFLFVLMNLFMTSSSDAARKGGVFKFNLGGQPTTVNPLSSTDHYASKVQGYVIESLLSRDNDTYERKPSLAKEWKISKDKKTFTFTLRDGVKWHDGKPLTVEDVKFSFDAIMDKDNKYKTAHMKPYFESIKGVKIVNKNTIQFEAKSLYFKNFDVVSGMGIVPKHLYEKPSKKMKKKLNKILIGTGPYKFKSLKKGKSIILERNKEWWGGKVDDYKNDFNFDKIIMRFVSEDTIAIQRMEKGDFDYLSLGPEAYEVKTRGKKWGKSVFKVKYNNKAPRGYSFIAWNLKHPTLKSKKVRKALYHLVNRDLMIKKFLYGHYVPATGPWYRQSEYANPNIKALDFDPKKALAILKEEGWKDSDNDAILDKVIDGKKMSLKFTILEPSKDFVKYLTIFKEDAKKAGVEVNIKFIEWNSFVKLLDERKFEAVRLAWTAGSIDMDPKQVWHSSSAKLGSNFISYNNPKVDKLIDSARLISDRKKRVEMYRSIYKYIAEDYPYVFLFNGKSSFYGYSKKMNRPKDTRNYSVGVEEWWISK